VRGTEGDECDLQAVVGSVGILEEMEQGAEGPALVIYILKYISFIPKMHND